MRHQKVVKSVDDGEAATRFAPALIEDDAFGPLRVCHDAALEPVGVDILYPNDAKPRTQRLSRHRHGKVRLGLQDAFNKRFQRVRVPEVHPSDRHPRNPIQSPSRPIRPPGTHDLRTGLQGVRTGGNPTAASRAGAMLT